MEQELQQVNLHSHLAEWSRRVKACRKSGQRISEWCGAHGTPVSTHLLWYLEGGQLELSTSWVERSIKPFVIECKNFLFANTPLGAQARAVIYNSLIATAKETGLAPFHYLTWVLETAPILDHILEGWAVPLLLANAPLSCQNT